MRILFLAVIFCLSSSLHAQFMDPQNAAIIAELETIILQNQARNIDLARQLTEAMNLTDAANQASSTLNDIKEYEKKIRRDVEALKGLGVFNLSSLESMVLSKLNDAYEKSTSRKFLYENTSQILKLLSSDFKGSALSHSDIHEMEKKTSEEAMRLRIESIKAIEKQSVILSEQAIGLKKKAENSAMLTGPRLNLIDRSNELMRKSIEYKIKASEMLSETSRLIFQQLKDKTANTKMVESIENKKEQKRRYGLFDSPFYTR